MTNKATERYTVNEMKEIKQYIDNNLSGSVLKSPSGRKVMTAGWSDQDLWAQAQTFIKARKKAKSIIKKR